MPISAIILAAGRGTRMKSPLPKVLHPIAGKPLIAYPLSLCSALKIKNPTLVVGLEHHELKNYLKNSGANKINLAVQNPPKGTGHAVQVGIQKISKKDDVLILYGDMPLIQKETLQELIKIHKQTKSALSFVTVITDRISSFGRIVRDRHCNPIKIVEFKDASREEKAIQELNVGIYIARGDFLEANLKKLQPKNNQNEYYLTDLICMANSNKQKMATYTTNDLNETLGVNTMNELSEAEQIVMEKHRKDLMDNGVRIVQPKSILIEETVNVGQGSMLMGPLTLLGKSKIGKNCIIEPGVLIRNSILEDNVNVKANSYIDGAVINAGATIGPFAHLRPQSEIGEDAKVGNFVEIKKSKIGKGSKVNHLSYIGDAEIGKNVNVGAGTITCNYDGVNKFKTILEDNVFVGSDTQFVAPVRIGKGATIGAGSTITKNVGANSLALSRIDQKEIKGWKRKVKS